MNYRNIIIILKIIYILKNYSPGFDAATIDNVTYAVDCYGRFCNVCTENHLPGSGRRITESLHLLGLRQIGKQWANFQKRVFALQVLK